MSKYAELDREFETIQAEYLLKTPVDNLPKQVTDLLQKFSVLCAETLDQLKAEKLKKSLPLSFNHEYTNGDRNNAWHYAFADRGCNQIYKSRNQDLCLCTRDRDHAGAHDGNYVTFSEDLSKNPEKAIESEEYRLKIWNRNFKNACKKIFTVGEYNFLCIKNENHDGECSGNFVYLDDKIADKKAAEFGEKYGSTVIKLDPEHKLSGKELLELFQDAGVDLVLPNVNATIGSHQIINCTIHLPGKDIKHKTNLCAAIYDYEPGKTFGCSKLAGHEGFHEDGKTTWKDTRCGDKFEEYTCGLISSHEGEHQAGTVAWPRNPEECAALFLSEDESGGGTLDRCLLPKGHLGECLSVDRTPVKTD